MNTPIEHLTMAELIERSSLGSPEALAFRRQTPRWVTILIVALLAADDVVAAS